MNTIGFCSSLNDLLSKSYTRHFKITITSFVFLSKESFDVQIIDGGINDIRIVGTIALAVMIVICAVGMEWESKAQNFLIAIIVAAIFNFIIGASMGPQDDTQIAQGFVGLSCKYFLGLWLIWVILSN